MAWAMGTAQVLAQGWVAGSGMEWAPVKVKEWAQVMELAQVKVWPRKPVETLGRSAQEGRPDLRRCRCCP